MTRPKSPELDNSTGYPEDSLLAPVRVETNGTVSAEPPTMGPRRQLFPEEAERQVDKLGTQFRPKRAREMVGGPALTDDDKERIAIDSVRKNAAKKRGTRTKRTAGRRGLGATQLRIADDDERARTIAEQKHLDEEVRAEVHDEADEVLGLEQARRLTERYGSGDKPTP